LQAQEKPEVTAIQLFDSGNYEAAEALFKQLLEQNPDNPVSQYYYGAARTENQHYTDEAMNWLLSAGQDITPDRLNYYLGVQHHARENWDQALKYYNLFRISVPQTEQKAVDLDKKIQHCFNRENPFTDSPGEAQENNVVKKVQQAKATGNNSSPKDTIVNEDLSDYPDNFTADNSDEINLPDLFVPREALPNLPDVQASLPAGDRIEFQVNNSITYQFTSQFQTDEGR